ncbi:MAG: hypothetical protein QXX95_02945 [Nitrososphaerales archaeon]
MDRRKAFLVGAIFSTSLLLSCGGIGAGTGAGNGSSGSDGLYELGIVLDNGTNITSKTPTVSYTDTGTITVNENPDAISGYVYYIYKGKNYDSAMRLYIQEANICVNGIGCYPLGLGGSLSPSDMTKTTFGILYLSDYKFSKPWLEVNPYEDTVIKTYTYSFTIPVPSGNTISYQLQDDYVGNGTIKKGRVINIYEVITNQQGQEEAGPLLCNNIGNTDNCTVSRDNNGLMTITFTGSKPQKIMVEYTADLYVDLNRDITITDRDRKTTNTVDGYVYVKGKLDSGDTLQASLPIKFVIVR